MTIARSVAVNYLNANYSNFATLIGQALTTDAPTGWGPDIDNALRELGYAEADLASAAVDETKRKDYFVLLDYFAAKRFWAQASALADVRLGPQSESYGKVMDAAQALMKNAAAGASVLGYSLEDDSTWQYAQFPTDHIEPRPLWDRPVNLDWW